MTKGPLSHIMCDHPIKISEDVNAGTVAHLLLRYRINGILVVNKDDSECLVGVFTTTDCLKLLEQAFSSGNNS